MDVTRPAREIGAELRGARCRARLTQAQVGEAVGYSASAVSRIEAGRMRLEYNRLRAFAAFLGIPPDRLTGTPVPGPATVDTVRSPADEEDAVRRRNLLTGALAAGATAALGAPAASAASAGGDPAAPLEDFLFRLPSASPVPLARLVQKTASARADFRAARYNALGRALPGLLAAASATREEATGHEREKASLVLARSYVLAAELALKQHSDAAWAAADRALTAARASGHPVPVGEASRVLAITMRRSGNCPSAVRLLTREAGDLDAGQEQTGAVRTTLMLTAAYSAATGGDRTTALDLLDAAEEETARREATPSGLFTVDATRTQVDVYRIGVLNALGTPDEGVSVARRINIDGMPTPERRARAWTDTARMWHALRDGRQTFAALRHVEQEAPQEVRRPALQALTTDLLYASARVPGVREFAARTGAISA
ncbi:helix-turn-helix domain-containing protein [Streptomyces malaysiensis]|uniref:Helix-turn-helix domain-containing protein n=1 Tax=Streptomyces malaysiensis subsp. samsunensis TaxID=459658 RepID=A0A9X2RTL4_STRMQ|nr:helix-turn-helix transcriptional regulator [Streptomyces samsunensis]MCQ8830606.1 helix-turn-helix domain-containing protein [Streptomyces samsunensis]